MPDVTVEEKIQAAPLQDYQRIFQLAEDLQEHRKPFALQRRWGVRGAAFDRWTLNTEDA